MSRWGTAYIVQKGALGDFRKRTWSPEPTPSSGLRSLQTLNRRVSVIFVGGDEREREMV